MHIAIDIRSIFGNKTGKGYFTKYLIGVLLTEAVDWHFTLYAPVTRDKKEDIFTMFHLGAQTKIATVDIRGIAGTSIQWHMSAARDIARTKPDMFFSTTSFIIPALLPKEIKSIITVHDLVAFLFPKDHELKATVVERIFLPKALKKASRVICVSQNTKQDLLKRFHYPEKQVDVIYPASCLEFFDKGPKTNPRAKFYILGVGTIEPRKNFSTLIKAFEIFHKKNPDVELVIAGGKGWKASYKIPNGLPVVWHGYTDQKTLRALYRNASMFVFPSLYEGFGIPPLEAMAAGCPVICSNTASLPEVVGSAAVLVDPCDVEAIADAMEKIHTDNKLRTKLIKQGLEQVKKFSWGKSACRLMDVVRQTISDDSQ